MVYTANSNPIIEKCIYSYLVSTETTVELPALCILQQFSFVNLGVLVTKPTLNIAAK